MSDYRKYILNKKEILFLIVVSLGLSFSVGILFYNTYVFSCLSPIVFFALKQPLERILRDRRQKKLREEFRDVLYIFSSSFAAGMHLEEAMENSINQIKDVYGDDADMAGELTYMVKRIKEAGESEVSLWSDLAVRSELEDIKDFAAVFSACRDAGGNLVVAVDRASNIIVDKINIENEMRLMFSQKKLEGHMIGLMPIVMIVFLRITSHSYLDVMYEGIIGRGLMTLALLLMVIATYLTERITDVKL